MYFNDLGIEEKKGMKILFKSIVWVLGEEVSGDYLVWGRGVWSLCLSIGDFGILVVVILVLFCLSWKYSLVFRYCWYRFGISK